MAHDLSARIEYSEKYVDDTHEYRSVRVLRRSLQYTFSLLLFSSLTVVWMASRARAATRAFRHVILPKEMQRSLPDRLLSESEWRQLGVQQSRGWVHYAIHKCVTSCAMAEERPRPLQIVMTDSYVCVFGIVCAPPNAGRSRTFCFSDVRLARTRPPAASTPRSNEKPRTSTPRTSTDRSHSTRLAARTHAIPWQQQQQ